VRAPLVFEVWLGVVASSRSSTAAAACRRAGFLDETAGNITLGRSQHKQQRTGRANGSLGWWAAAAALAPIATKPVVRDESWLPPRSWTATGS
jgi:hypothetical protein